MGYGGEGRVMGGLRLKWFALLDHFLLCLNIESYGEVDWCTHCIIKSVGSIHINHAIVLFSNSNYSYY